MRDIKIGSELILKSISFIENIFGKEKIKIHPGSWLGKYISISKNVAAGKRYKNQRQAFVITASMISLAEDLQQCMESGVELKQRLKDSMSEKYTDSCLHEISVISPLLRNKQKAFFIEKENSKTPDISIFEVGVIECKVAHNRKKVIDRIKDAADQVRGFPGQKLVDVFLYFPITTKEIEVFGNAVKDEVFSKMLRMDNISGLHAFSLRYLELTKTKDGKDVITLKAWWFSADETMSDVRKTISKFEEF